MKEQEAEMKTKEMVLQRESKMKEIALQKERKILQKTKEAAKLAVKAEILAKTFQDELSEENVKQLPAEEDLNSKMSLLLLTNKDNTSQKQNITRSDSIKILPSAQGKISAPQFCPLPSATTGCKGDENVLKVQKPTAGSQSYIPPSCPPASALWSLPDPRPTEEIKLAIPEITPLSYSSLAPAKGTEREKPTFSTPHQMFPTPSEAWNPSFFRSPKRDLKDKGVQKFSDLPEDFHLWKATFKRAIKDLNLLPEEELTLLIAWLGPTSSLQVQRVYAAFVSDPERALRTAWTRLQDKYGASTEIEASLLNRLHKFPVLKLKDCTLLWDLSDLLVELHSAKCNPELPGLACLDQYITQRQILQKLPFQFQEAWGKEVFNFKEQNMQKYPPFTHLVAFITRIAKERNDPQTGFPTLYQGFHQVKSPKPQKRQFGGTTKTTIAVKTTEVVQQKPEYGLESKQILCPIHKKPHSLADCTEFAKKSYEEKVAIVEKAKVCFKCCSSQSHFAKNCKVKVKCAECSSFKHCTAMHNFKARDKATNIERKASDAAPQTVPDSHKEERSPVVACTKLCQNSSQPRICHPICLAEVFPQGKPQLKKRLYVALDAQSDASLATPSFFDMFKVKAKTLEYVIFTCSGQQQLQGRVASDFIISPCNSRTSFKLPALLECSTIPRNKTQIVTKTIAKSHPHLKGLEKEIPHLDSEADIALLIGSDCPELFQILEQVRGPPGAPIAQRLPLGWIVIGPVCIDKMCPPTSFNIVGNGKFSNSRPTQMQSCLSHIKVCCMGITKYNTSIFEATCKDEDLSFSRDEQRFLDILNEETVQSEEGNWIAPLPFKDVRPLLPNNRIIAEKRLYALKRRMLHNPNLKSQIVKFMEDLFVCNYAEPAPQCNEDEEQWFLPFHKVTQPHQWNHIATEENPADIATRGVSAQKLLCSNWLAGPECLANPDFPKDNATLVFPELPEILPEVSSCKIEVSPVCKDSSCLDSSKFERFSKWHCLRRAIARLVHLAIFKRPATPSASDLLKAEVLILKSAQRCEFKQEFKCIERHQYLPHNSALKDLNPILDNKGLLRVGGRLKRAKISDSLKNPVILPASSHVSLLLVRHFHEKVHHQGRTLTEASIRNAGFWIINCRRLVNKVIHLCVTCRKLRKKRESQLMAELPEDRTSIAPPFTHIGLDVFGHWEIHTRKTRGGVVNNKRWAVLFTCLVIRAIHIEVIENMDSSSFINALRRFIAIRGPVKTIRSDCGTNFIGAVKELNCISKFANDSAIIDFANKENIQWTFNVPHASHMGGAWERMIGISRRILEAMLTKCKFLTHEILVTFLAEVTAIVNNRPLTPISSDPDKAQLLTPAMLLHFKTPDWKDIVFPVPEGMHTTQWKQVQSLACEFWKRWKAEYLSQLQQRKIWQRPQEDIKVGDLVLLRDKNASRNSWPTGIIKEVYPSVDGHVRKALIKTATEGKINVYQRPVSDLVVLLKV